MQKTVEGAVRGKCAEDENAQRQHKGESGPGTQAKLRTPRLAYRFDRRNETYKLVWRKGAPRHRCQSEAIS